MKVWINLTYQGNIIDAHEVIVYNDDEKSRTIEIKLDSIIDRVKKFIPTTKWILKEARRRLKKNRAEKPTSTKPTKKRDPTQ